MRTELLISDCNCPIESTLQKHTVLSSSKAVMNIYWQLKLLFVFPPLSIRATRSRRVSLVVSKRYFYFLMKTVLIVEDDLINARVFSKILTKRGGLDVKHTENVDEVMQIAASGGADIILMDVSLSRSVYQGKSVDGIKITQMLKSDPQTASLPIILVTAHAMEGDRENFLKQSGADGYISKPVVDHQQFVDQIVALLPKEKQ
jgi:two-component system, cell cycle response regulator DivK